MYARGGFTAGTMVQTDCPENDGLKRIEDIKVGDSVLSMPELCGGKPLFKKVLNTFEFDDQDIWMIETHGLMRGSTCMPFPYTRFGVTANYLFWMVGYAASNAALETFMPLEQPRWVRSDLIPENAVLLGYMGVETFEYVMTVHLLSQYHDDPKLAWLPTNDSDCTLGSLYDLSTGVGSNCFEMVNYNDASNTPLLDGSGEYPPFRAKVYSIEVEDFHTFFVGQEGLWVSHANGGTPLPTHARKGFYLY